MVPTGTAGAGDGHPADVRSPGSRVGRDGDSPARPRSRNRLGAGISRSHVRRGSARVRGRDSRPAPTGSGRRRRYGLTGQSLSRFTDTGPHPRDVDPAGDPPAHGVDLCTRVAGHRPGLDRDERRTGDHGGAVPRRVRSCRRGCVVGPGGQPAGTAADRRDVRRSVDGGTGRRGLVRLPRRDRDAAGGVRDDRCTQRTGVHRGRRAGRAVLGWSRAGHPEHRAVHHRRGCRPRLRSVDRCRGFPGRLRDCSDRTARGRTPGPAGRIAASPPDGKRVPPAATRRRDPVSEHRRKALPQSAAAIRSPTSVVTIGPVPRAARSASTAASIRAASSSRPR